MPKLVLTTKLRLGFLVFGVLMVLEVIEYIVGTTMKSGAWPYLAVFAVLAAAAIGHWFMHITHLWRPEE